MAIIIEGSNELVRAFGRVDKDLKRGLQRELRGAAQIVAGAAREKLSALNPPATGRTITGVRPRLRIGSAYVEQRLGKTTGKRGDWGATQMKRAFLPALSEKTDEVMESVERMLDKAADRNGFL